jgi:hypothetical protein
METPEEKKKTEKTEQATDDEFEPDEDDGWNTDDGEPSDQSGDEAGDEDEDEKSCEGQEPLPEQREAAAALIPKAKVRRSVTPRPSTGAFDTNKWIIDKGEGGKATLKLCSSGRTFSVPDQRLNRALTLLDPDKVAQDVADGHKKCVCSRECHSKFTTANFVDRRLALLQQCGGDAIMNWVASQITVTTTTSSSSVSPSNKTSPKVTYVHHGIEVCPIFFCHLFRISRVYLYDARSLAVNGGRKNGHAKTGTTYNTIARSRAVSTCWWKMYFDDLCQRISDEKRLRPNNSVVATLYEAEFTEFCQQRAIKRPSLSTFNRAQKHVWFNDVSKRTRHNHVRCSTCAELSAMKTKAWREGEDIGEIMTKVRAHSDEVRRWRENETYWKLRSEHSPHICNTIMADDTSAWRAPHFTNRPIKAVATKYRCGSGNSDTDSLPGLVASSDDSSDSSDSSDLHADKTVGHADKLPALISSSDDSDAE